ncbi:hypothetical protein PCASD_20488 [Puccinia coronata f. sp. avenae]|uniref:MmgE/PrpD C-terminal domain-containing protein n=1 Tax=Puccinia coronata f. sp. avenae TaxID=200324 RepID=A0A2N5SJU5_9BASI|nr:hypothetical protein PCASD_20488 [Puccinia coronata f. sp. avenae]
MVAIPLIFGRLTTEDYTDKVASDPRIDELRAKISCSEEKKYSEEYHAPDKRSIGNAITIELKDGTVLDEVEIEYPVAINVVERKANLSWMRNSRDTSSPTFVYSSFFISMSTMSTPCAKSSTTFSHSPSYSTVHGFCNHKFSKAQVTKILEVVNDQKTLENYDVDKFMDLWVKS